MRGGSLLRRLARLVPEFLCNERGNFAITTALIMPVVLVAAFGTIDVTRAVTTRHALQDALDAGALSAARLKTKSAADLQKEGESILAANLYGMDGMLLSSRFVHDGAGRTVIADASAELPATILGVFQGNRIVVSVHSEVARASTNIEVALVLDTTGSMAGQKIADLRAAAADLVDIVVQDDQGLAYSKVALVPYAMAVNAGAYAGDVRGGYAAGTCTSPGCQAFKFGNPLGGRNTFAISTCVTERGGANAFTDAAPKVAPLGANYASPSNPCLQNTITPLSSDKRVLKGAIGALKAGGSTGGHIGVAWGWYLVSPHFAYLWPEASRPAAYGVENLDKVVVIMTDGEYNSVYCNGVISRDSTSGSGSAADHIDCDAPNGGSYSQAQKLCANMKAAGVKVYTVGFDVVDSRAARDLVAKCATDASHVYLPSTGAALKDAFRAIAQDISGLRLSR